jgi:NAD(P)-dependent dehydrogenase (short-subunit alcohol dehydrogenase family)
LFVYLKTGGILESNEVSILRKTFGSEGGIVHVATTEAKGISDEERVVDLNNPPLSQMKQSLNALGWSKKIVNFRFWFPMAHLAIVANERFPKFLRSILGIDDGQFVMNDAAVELTSDVETSRCETKKGTKRGNSIAVYAVIFVVVLAIGLIIFVKIAMRECGNYTVPSLSGKVVVITGANSGLGYYSSLTFAKAGATVVMACRNATKAKTAVSEILSEWPGANVKVVELDLASLKSVKEFAATVSKSYKSVDVLMNNAAEMAIPRREVTVDGFERQMGINHLSHFLLTGLLLPSIAKDGRIVNVASGAYMFAAKNFTYDLQSGEKYDPWVAYGNTKAANLFFTYELNQRLQSSGSSVIAIATHPGYTATNLQTSKFPFWSYLNYLFAMNLSEGALSQIIAAVDPNVRSSKNDFIGPKYLSFGYPTLTKTTKVDEKVWKHLWEESYRLTGPSPFGKL